MRRYVIWGTGKRAEQLAAFLDMDFVAFAIDKDETLDGSKWHGIPIYCIDTGIKLLSTYDNNYLILITPNNSYDIIEYLQSKRIDNFILLKDYVNIYIHQAFMNGRVTCCSNDEIVRMIQESKYLCLSGGTDLLYRAIEIIHGKKTHTYADSDVFERADLFARHGINFDIYDAIAFTHARKNRIPIVFTEDGYISSIEPHLMNSLNNDRYCFRHSVVFDRSGLPINACVSSMLENILNSEFTLTKTQFQRARDVIRKLRETKISKYNHQPVFRPRIGVPFQKKVLVVDQVYGDKSIEYGNANDMMFDDMLSVAMCENPKANIIVKSHPDTRKSHYTKLSDKGNVLFIDYEINPISLIDEVDKVYVCTSQMGFEAAFCGKEVHVFGMPFYAGWGSTFDRQTFARRVKRRSIEEIFYVAYILCSVYVSYKDNCVCEIEQTIDELVELRDEYWQRKLRPIN